MIMTILVPVDGSEHASKAVQLAADIAEKYDARLVLLNVLPRGPLPEALRHWAEVEHLGAAGASEPEAGGEEDSRRDVYALIGQRILDSAAAIAKKKRVARIDSFTADGDPAKRILEYAEDQKANLIVMGSRGVSDLRGLLMGSVSHKVSHLAPCSCVTVR
ncbi:MAG: universal stress protein [Kiloniellales bacterium]